MFEREGNSVGGEKSVVEAKHGEHAEGRAGCKVQRGGEDIGASALGADQGARNMEVVFRQQLVEVVAGDAAGDAGKLLADERGIAVADARKAGVDLTNAAASANERVKALGRRGSHDHARTVVEDDVERFHVVNHFAAEQAMHAATVIADHAAESTTGMRRRIGRVGKLMQLGSVAQAVENDAGFDTSKLGARVNRGERVHVPRVIKDNGDVDALAGEAGARTTRKNGGAGGTAGGQCGLHVGRVARKDDADGELAVVRRVSSVKSARAWIKAHFATKGILQQALKLVVSGKAFMAQWSGVGENGKCGRAHAAMVAREGGRLLSNASATGAES